MFNFIKRLLIKRHIHNLKEPMPLPMGRQEFEQWSTRIINSSHIPGATFESQQFALADMLLHIKPTQSFECDAHFVHSLRKGAVNEIAHAVFVELKKARQLKEQGGVTPKVDNFEQKVLDNVQV